MHVIDLNARRSICVIDFSQSMPRTNDCVQIENEPSFVVKFLTLVAAALAILFASRC